MSRKSKGQVPGDLSDSEEEIQSDEEGAVRVDGIYIPPAPQPYCSTENKGPRLVITQITNDFFKSYAHKVVLGPFHKAFNAIIGPNGSGKSNVIDSMLFVFGFRANRMRSKKLSVLIHNSSKFTNVPSATVTVHFARIVDNDDDEFETVPNSEFTVSRTVNKDNSSYYTIDGRRVHFKEVAVLLKQNGIDLKHNRFLILQGEVEQIAMMPAKSNGNDSGMLEYLEDIIGTTRYKAPLEQLSQRVDEYWDKRTEKANRLKIVQDEVEVLREPMEDAVEFLKLENNIAREKNIVYQHNIYATKENMKEVTEKKEELDQEVQGMKDKLTVVTTQKKEKQAELDEVSRKYELVLKQKESMREVYDNANTKHVQLQAQMQQTNSDRHKFKDQLTKEQKKLEDYRLQPEEIENKIQDCEKAIEKLAPKAEEIQEEKMKLLASMKDLTKDLQQEKDVLTETLIGLMETVTESKTAFTVAEGELKVLTSNSDKEKQKLETLEASYEEIKTKIGQLTTETKKLESVLPQKEKELQQAMEELPGLKQKEEQVLNKLRSTRAKVAESKASMQASSSKNRVLDALQQQKREGKIPGFYGRLGDLGAIDAKYDVAISTACGALDNIVVDSIETGQWCIEFLKKHDIGRTTIIVLALQQHLLDRCNTPIRTPENVSRLFDLIRIPDETIRPAFYYALRDTLVANNLDQASRIAYGEQRYRVVTLKGELIETTGAMSGGGNRVLRGRMGQSVQMEINPQELAAIEREMGDEEIGLETMRQRHNELENIVALVQPEVKNMRSALEKMSLELKGLKQREPNVAAQIKEQRNRVKRVSINLDQVRKMEKEVESKKAKYDAAAEKAQVVQEKVDALTNKINEKSHGKVKTLDGKLKECNKNIEKLKTEMTRLRVSVKTVEKNIIKSEKLVESLQVDIKTAETNLLEMKAQREQIEEDADKCLKMIEEFTARIEDGSEVFNDLKNDIKELDKCEAKLKSENIEIDQRMKAVKEELAQFQQKIHGFRMKLSQLKLQELPHEGVEPFNEYSDAELEQMDVEKSVKQIGLYEIQLRNSKPNLAAIEEYRKKAAVAATRSKELEEVVMKLQQVRECYDGLRTRRKDEFMAGYRIIKNKLKEMYQMITIGGDADFELVDTYDPFSEGIVLRVRPPKKTWKHISNLSGGEKTLSSLALVFALHYYKPSPLYVLDEIDAALDFKNVSIIANYIKERTKNAQFIIISLRHEMFELSCHLIGIFKPDNTTKTMTVDPRKYGGEREPSATQQDRMIQGGQQFFTATQNRNISQAIDNFAAGSQAEEEINLNGENHDNDMEVDSISTIAQHTVRSTCGAVTMLNSQSNTLTQKKSDLIANEDDELSLSQDLFSSNSSEISSTIPATQPSPQENEAMEADE